MQEKNFYIFRVNNRGKIYYYQIRDPKTRRLQPMRSTGEKNATLAERFAQGEYDKLVKTSGSAGIPLRDWADRFYIWPDDKGKTDCPHINRLLDEGKSIKKFTARQKREYIEKYLLNDTICMIPLGMIRKADVMDFRDRIVALKGRTRTAQMIYGVLQTILLEAVTRGLIESSPTEGLHNLNYEKQTRRALDISDVVKILNPANWSNLAAWRATYIAAMTGMRIGEVRGLEWQDVDAAKKVILVRHNITVHSTDVTRPKWGKVRVTIYPESLAEMMEPLREKTGRVLGGESPLGYKTIRGALEEACLKAEVRATLHQLRHTLQTYLRGKGVPDDLLRGAFGWSDASTQDIYTHRELYDLEPIQKALPQI